MEQDKVIERLKSYIELECNSEASFAKMAGIDPSNFAKMLDGKQNITRNTIKKIENAHDININWLTSGNGEMKNSSKRETINIGSNNKGKTEIGNIGHVGNNVGGGNSHVGISVGRDNTGEISFHKERMNLHDNDSTDKDAVIIQLKEENETLRKEIENLQKSINEKDLMIIKEKERLIQLLTKKIN